MSSALRQALQDANRLPVGVLYVRPLQRFTLTEHQEA